MKTGIALSGGGVRASVFHMGVLARLAEDEMWSSLEHISTVSGGSLAIALVFEKAGKQWPDAQTYLDQCLPKIHQVLTTYNLQRAYAWRFLPALISGKAHIIAKLITKHWGITSCISEMPEYRPRWSINSTCYETGKNWRFHKQRMGDYIAYYVIDPKFPMADAVASSAAVPGAIGPLKLKTSKYKWHKYSNGGSPDIETDPVAKTLTLWDGGVYDNLGVEAIYKTGKGLRYDLNFALVSDASKPLEFSDRKWFGRIPIPKSPMRLVDIPMDQVRSLRARQLFKHFKENENGGYLRMGESVPKICKALKVSVPDAQYMNDTEIKVASDYPTTLKKLSKEDYSTLFQHGYEVCSAVLYGIKKSSYLEFDKTKYGWLKQ